MEKKEAGPWVTGAGVELDVALEARGTAARADTVHLDHSCINRSSKIIRFFDLRSHCILIAEPSKYLRSISFNVLRFSSRLRLN